MCIGFCVLILQYQKFDSLVYTTTPKGRPNPPDPKGGAGATPRHPAPRRDEGARRPTRRAAPTDKKVTPRPLR